jgi:hypothetical protein
LVCAAVLLADRSGPIGSLKESFVGVRALMEAAKSGGHGELVDAVAQSAMKSPQKGKTKGFKRARGPGVEWALDELHAIDDLLTIRVQPKEATAFREWLYTTAQRAAEAAKEGLGRKRVSEQERRMLNQLREVLSLPPRSS